MTSRRAHRPGRRPHRSTCGGCRLEVIWVRMVVTGAAMPLDPTPLVVRPATDYIAAGVPVPHNLVVRDARGFGRVVHRPEPGTVGFVSHFATCTRAGELRRRPAPPAAPPQTPAPAPDPPPAEPPPVQLSLDL